MDLAKFPLKVLVCDIDKDICRKFKLCISHHHLANEIFTANSVIEAHEKFEKFQIEVILIDLESTGYPESQKFVRHIRETCPAIPFVLLIDPSKKDSYQYNQSRFKHYYRVNKCLSGPALLNDVKHILLLCRIYLFWSKSQEAIESAATSNGGKPDVLIGFRNLLALGRCEPGTVPGEKSVFISCRFKETEYLGELTSILTENGFDVHNALDVQGSISTAIIEKIRACRFFVSLMSRHEKLENGNCTTGPWLLEEKGAAVALKKKVVMLVENGVNQTGEIQSDIQWIGFNKQTFPTAANRALQQLILYSNKEISNKPHSS